MRIAVLVLAMLLTASGASSAAPRLALTVLSYNIHSGIGSDGVFDLPRVAEVIRAQRPDVVGLQEVDVAWSERSGFVDEARELAEALHMNVFFAPIYDLPGTPPRSFGVAVLSRFPILRAVNHPITRLSTQDPNATPAPTPGFAEVLVGDLNAEPAAPELAPLWQRLTDAGGTATFPANQPVKRIDYVAVSRDLIVGTTVRTLSQCRYDNLALPRVHVFVSFVHQRHIKSITQVWKSVLGAQPVLTPIFDRVLQVVMVHDLRPAVQVHVGQRLLGVRGRLGHGVDPAVKRSADVPHHIGMRHRDLRSIDITRRTPWYE